MKLIKRAFYSGDKKVIKDFLSSASNKNMEDVVKLFSNSTVPISTIAALAIGLADSGKLLSHSKRTSAIDLASTGGPTSLSTLLTPLMFSAIGNIVPKLGIVGRPAGGVDVMAQIPGYQTRLNIKQITRSLNDSGYAHFEANNIFAPLDEKLFTFRQSRNKQNVPDLAVASILSKKIASGITVSGLDVRVAKHGNFGQNWNEAKKNAQRFNAVCSLVGIKSRCFLTNAEIPYQPYFGRGESLVALHELFFGSPELLLKKHYEDCIYFALSTISAGAEKAPNLRQVVDAFSKNLKSQGSNIGKFHDVVASVKKESTFKIFAPKNGFLKIDIGALRTIISSIQKSEKTSGINYPDNIGATFSKQADAFVLKGEQLASIRCSKNVWQRHMKSLEKPFSLERSIVEKSGIEMVINE